MIIQTFKIKSLAIFLDWLDTYLFVAVITIVIMKVPMTFFSNFLYPTHLLESVENEVFYGKSLVWYLQKFFVSNSSRSLEQLKVVVKVYTITARKNIF